MDCEFYTRGHRRIRCEHWDRCHKLGYSLCELEHREETQLQQQTQKTAWPVRRQQLLDLAKQHETINTAMVMELTGAANSTAWRWLRSLVRKGELTRLTNAVLAGANSQPATFAITEKEEI